MPLKRYGYCAHKIYLDEKPDGEWVKWEDHIAEVNKFRHELLWIWEDVWPLVHGLTSRDTVRERFKKLPQFLGSC